VDAARSDPRGADVLGHPRQFRADAVGAERRRTQPAEVRGDDVLDVHLRAVTERGGHLHARAVPLRVGTAVLPGLVHVEVALAVEGDHRFEAEVVRLVDHPEQHPRLVPVGDRVGDPVLRRPRSEVVSEQRIDLGVHGDHVTARGEGGQHHPRPVLHGAGRFHDHVEAGDVRQHVSVTRHRWTTGRERLGDAGGVVAAHHDVLVVARPLEDRERPLGAAVDHQRGLPCWHAGPGGGPGRGPRTPRR
jgi:hypothetical protein